MAGDGRDGRPLSTPALVLAELLALGLFVLLVSLGRWQLHRLSWKLDLIARVERQLAAAPSSAPVPAEWSALTSTDAYRRVQLQGEYRHDLETCTQAVTELGAGCWVLTPLHTSAGWWVLVNRGFVDATRRDAETRAAGQISGSVEVEGLLRLSEPGGGFLRRNQPQANRWYSRDVVAIGAARGLPANALAPYFIDAANTVEGGPVGGLTVVRFHNTHLIYAITWFGLAALLLFGVSLVVRREQRLRAR